MTQDSQTITADRAFLVERHHPDCIEYVSLSAIGVEWVSDASKALWCVRRSDAEQLASGSFDGDDIRIAEHLWPELAKRPDDGWPPKPWHCAHKISCMRHRQCMYSGCVHSAALNQGQGND